MQLRVGEHVGRRLAEVERFSAEHTTPNRIDEVWASGTVHDPMLHKALAEAGWIGASWPAPLGGGLHPAEVGALWEAMNYHRLPVDVLELTEMAAWVVLHAGTEDQRAAILPAVRAGDLLLSLGYTEPDAGSDVAAAATSARRDRDGWRIDGSKIFTTGAHVADLVLLLARTDRTVPKHRGLSMFLVPLNADGIGIDPIHTFGGERTNAVFFDRVHVGADAIVGEVDRGWSVLNLGLDFERSMMGTYVGRAQRVLDDLVDALAALGRLGDPVIRAELAVANVRIEAARVMADDVYCRLATGRPVTVEAAMTKLLATEVFKDLGFRALDLVGPRSLWENGDGLVSGRLEHAFRHSQIATIYGGSNEIQRNIIAQHRLGLPRS